MKNLGKLLILVAVVVAACGGCYLWGKHNAPTKIEYKEKVVERIVKVVDTAKDETKKTDLQVNTHKVITKKKDGTTVTVIDTVVKNKTDDQKHEVTKTTIDDQKTTEISKITTTYRPDWRVSVLAGVNFREAVKLPIGLNTFEYGIKVDRRLIGPLFVGVFGITPGVIGVSVSLDF